MKDILKNKNAWIAFAICFFSSGWLFFVEYQYKFQGAYAVANIERLWWTEGEESDSYYVAYSYIDKHGNHNNGSHAISESLWNRLDSGEEAMPMVQYVPGSRDRLLGKNNWFWAFAWLIAAFIFKKVFTHIKLTDADYTTTSSHRRKPKLDGPWE